MNDSTKKNLAYMFELSVLRRRESQLSSSLSSSLNKVDSTMQQCWLPCEADLSIETSVCQNTLPPCEFCFEPSNSVIMTDIFNTNRERQCSEPVLVPESTTALADGQQQPQQQSHSSGYQSTFGNELSPTQNYWILGINDYASCQSTTSDDLFNDQDQCLFDDNSTNTTTNGTDEQDIDDDSFEVLSFEAPPESSIYFREFQYTTSHSQNNVCDCCNKLFASVSNLPPRRCYYYGKLYCPRCHLMDYAYIPAKIIKSFDMHLYPVCRRAKSILQSNFYQPIFDIQNDNENLYVLQPILSDIRSSRIQFQHYYAYLSTCTRIENELNEKFLKEFYARDYLYQSIHLYSLNDLLSLKKILQILNIASIRAKQHIYQCMICREKGFICEICKNRKDILYPFDDIKTIGRCNNCSNIYHRKCWDNIDHDCPKCYRLIQRKHEQDII
ncbi:unnamed protein product [Rotaria sp. Silwood1]|nr:unnamed protein product [Rotaria sp. Silwood1]CAF0738170.1 unnamed protein product [Rotaria sp. Silwood1]CAF3327198.1 unnamed protein product [Rotaria sp. Silwood1]CAF4545226.1 unnamed protein product [Rotaria sp. Silwood1]CAF4574762.1 unnamed protein product [Rotaria sp. Silwood1]